MEPRREEQQKPPDVHRDPKPKRFRIVKLEERIVPGNGTSLPCCGTNHGNTHKCPYPSGASIE